MAIITFSLGAAFIAAASAQRCSLQECSSTTLSGGAVIPAFYICDQAINQNTIPTEVSQSFSTLDELKQVCQGMCTADSRLAYDTYSGAVWDICSGCDSSTVDTICNFCDELVGVQNNAVGVCGANNHARAECSFEAGDGQGTMEEYVGAFPIDDISASQISCFDLVRQHRPTANGATFSLDDGLCYAEYAVTGEPHVDSRYTTCVFVFNPTPSPTIAAPVQSSTTGAAPTDEQGDLSSDTTTTDEPIPQDSIFVAGSDGNPKGKKKEKGKGKKGDKKGKKGKKGKIGFLYESKNVIGLSAGAIVLMAGATALFVTRRRNAHAQAAEQSEMLLNNLNEQTPLIEGHHMSRKDLELQELVPMMK